MTEEYALFNLDSSCCVSITAANITHGVSVITAVTKYGSIAIGSAK